MSTSPDVHVDGSAAAAAADAATSTPTRRRSDQVDGRRAVRRIWGAVTILGLLVLIACGAWQVRAARAADEVQASMAAEWAARDVGTAARADARSAGRDPVVAVPAFLDDSAAIARIVVVRPGSGPLLGGAFYVGEGIAQAQIDRGPAHYPDSATPGGHGNFAVAGHRTTHGAPFGALDELRPGDQIRVTDRAGRRFVYLVVEQQVVSPTDTWVVGDDPLGTGRPMLTFTTCHPRFSARQRLVVWAELQPSGGPQAG